MFKSFHSLVAISMLTILFGCAGRDFVRPNQEAFKLGQTTYSQVLQQLGQPRQGANVFDPTATIEAQFDEFRKPCQGGYVAKLTR